jgi:hypothetical protein
MSKKKLNKHHVLSIVIKYFLKYINLHVECINYDVVNLKSMSFEIVCKFILSKTPWFLWISQEMLKIYIVSHNLGQSKL